MKKRLWQLVYPLAGEILVRFSAYSNSQYDDTLGGGNGDYAVGESHTRLDVYTDHFDSGYAEERTRLVARNVAPGWVYVIYVIRLDGSYDIVPQRTDSLRTPHEDRVHAQLVEYGNRAALAFGLEYETSIPYPSAVSTEQGGAP